MKGKAFRPVEGNTGTQAKQTYSCWTIRGTHYVAVFNYTQNAAQHTVDLFVPVSLRRGGLLYGDGCMERPISDGVWLFAGCDAKAAESKLYKIVLNP